MYYHVTYKVIHANLWQRQLFIVNHPRAWYHVYQQGFSLIGVCTAVVVGKLSDDSDLFSLAQSISLQCLCISEALHILRWGSVRLSCQPPIYLHVALFCGMPVYVQKAINRLSKAGAYLKDGQASDMSGVIGCVAAIFRQLPKWIIPVCGSNSSQYGQLTSHYTQSMV